MEEFKTNFKQPRSAKVERFQKRIARKNTEDAKKKQVRQRDKHCRFPLCGCRKFGLRLEVSHNRHKGMGGNPAGDRSEPELMILACYWRHQSGRVAIDRGTLQWRPLDPERGANGPVVWEVDPEAIGYPTDEPWIEVAREKAVNQLEEIAPEMERILRQLAQMTT